MNQNIGSEPKKIVWPFSLMGIILIVYGGLGLIFIFALVIIGGFVSPDSSIADTGLAGLVLLMMVITALVSGILSFMRHRYLFYILGGLSLISLANWGINGTNIFNILCFITFTLFFWGILSL